MAGGTIKKIYNNFNHDDTSLKFIKWNIVKTYNGLSSGLLYIKCLTLIDVQINFSARLSRITLLLYSFQLMH